MSSNLNKKRSHFILLNRNKSFKFLRTVTLSYIIIFLFIISSLGFIQSNQASVINKNTSNDSISNISNYLDSLIKQSPLLNTNSKSDLKNVIFTYSSLKEKTSILNYVKTNGLLVNQLHFMPYILAKIPESQFSLLKNHNVNVMMDKKIQVIPQNIDSVSSSIPINSSYKAPIHQINGD